MEIKAIDREAARTLRATLEKLFEDNKAVFDGVGIVPKVGSGRFSPQSLTFKIELAVKGDAGEPVGREVEDFKRWATIWGLTPDALGSTLTFRGEKYTLVGAKPRSHAYPLLAKRACDGKVFKLPVSAAGGTASPRLASSRWSSRWCR